MVNSLFPNHYHLSEAGFLTPNYNSGLWNNFYIQSGNSYSNLQIPYMVNQSTLRGLNETNSNVRLEFILIAILVLLSMDILFVRPLKK